MLPISARGHTMTGPTIIAVPTRSACFPPPCLPTQSVDFAVEELRRVAKRGFKAALVRPIIAQGKYPIFPEYDPLWREFEELGIVLGMHTFPSRGEAMSPELDQRMGANRKRLFSDEDILVYSPGEFVANIMQIMGSKQAGDAAYGFMAEAMTWTGRGADDRLAGKISQAESGDSRIQFKLAAAGPGKSRNLSRPLQTYRRKDRRPA